MSIDPEDAPDNVKEMLERVEGQLKLPELAGSVARGRPRPAAAAATSKYTMEGNAKARAMLGVGAAAGGAGAAAAAAASRGGQQAGAGATARATPAKGREEKDRQSGIEATAEKIDFLGIGLGKKVGQIEKFAHRVGDAIEDVFDSSSSSDDGSRASNLSHDNREAFETAMSHLERDNHRTALNYLVSLQEAASMKNPDFRMEMAECMTRVADSAMESRKVSVAADAYDLAYTIFRQEEGDKGEKATAAMRGCVKGHKLLAMETEDIRDYSSAIQHRMRVSQLLEENGKILPA